MGISESIILGLVEGITEFLPVSSTGHLILVSDLLRISTSEFTKSFEIIIQLGAILSVVALYWKKFLDRKILKLLLAGFIPTGIIGLIFYKLVKNYLLDSSLVVLWSLVLGGLFLIFFELYNGRKNKNRDVIEIKSDLQNITYKQSAIIGLFQAIAIIPGVSRSAATIVGGLILGIKRTTIVEFSFLLAVPTMLAATGLDLVKNASSFSSAEFSSLAIGFVVAFIVALFAIKFLLKFVRNHSFIPFGIYRIIIALFFAFLIL